MKMVPVMVRSVVILTNSKQPLSENQTYGVNSLPHGKQQMVTSGWLTWFVTKIGDRALKSNFSRLNRV